MVSPSMVRSRRLPPLPGGRASRRGPPMPAVPATRRCRAAKTTAALPEIPEIPHCGARCLVERPAGAAKRAATQQPGRHDGSVVQDLAEEEFGALVPGIGEEGLGLVL